MRSTLLLRRLGAYVLDVAVLFVMLAPPGYFVQRSLDISPVTAHEVYGTLVLNFSLPSWTYFALADRSRGGATLGKRVLSLHTEAEGGGRRSIHDVAASTHVRQVITPSTTLAA